MPHWNERQQDVLDSITEDQNILVSAAAGSGKTAVLVERIIQTVQQGLADSVGLCPERETLFLSMVQI